jgi:hypothetical protein
MLATWPADDATKGAYGMFIGGGLLALILIIILLLVLF